MIVIIVVVVNVNVNVFGIVVVVVVFYGKLKTRAGADLGGGCRGCAPPPLK